MRDLSIAQLKHRIRQPTVDLMAELGGAVPCGRGQFYAVRQTGAPVLAVAHCDCVDCGSKHFVARKGRVWSSRLDDRLGVYVLLDVLPALGIHVDVLLTDGEERGQSTAEYFRPESHNYNWMVQFDRRGVDAVVYEYEDMTAYAGEFFPLGLGSFSDICWLEHLGVCGVNIGTAYYNEHSLRSHANLDELRCQIRRFADMYARYATTQIEYTPRTGHWRDDMPDLDVLYWESMGSSGFRAEWFDGTVCLITYERKSAWPWVLSIAGREWCYDSLQEAKEHAADLEFSSSEGYLSADSRVGGW